MTTTTLERAARTAETRSGRDLLSMRMSGSLADKLAKAPTEAGGGKIARDVPVLKAGSFHGGAVQLDGADLAAMAERYVELRDSVGFVPPLRADHGWSVFDIVGHVVGLRVAELPDPADQGREKPFLVADLHVISPRALEAVGQGLWLNRSSEIGAYETNTGTLYSLAYWGLAFVDVPAVEGLGAVKLSAGAATAAPPTITELLEDPRMGTDAATTTATTPEQVAPDAAPGEQGPGADDTAAPAAAAADDAAGADRDADEDLEEVTPDEDEDDADEDADDDEDQEDADPVAAAALATVRASLAAGGAQTPAAVLRQLGMTDLAVQLETQQAADLDRQVTAYATAGKLGRTGVDQARVLLGHHDPAVAAATRALLDALPAPVKTGTAAGRQESNADKGPRGDESTSLSHLADAQTPREFGALWAQLSTAERQSPEGKAAYAARPTATPAV